MLTNIDKKTITYLIYNGNQNYEYFVHLKEIIQQNPILRNTLELYSLPFKKRIEYEFKSIREIIRLVKEKILTINHMKFLPYFLQYSHPFEIHYGLFRNVIETYGSVAQAEEWLYKVDEMKILGSLLLSEMNLFNNQRVSEIQDITTRATYIREKNVFVISNDDSNMKFCDYFSYYSTHVVVFARLFIEGKSYGVFPFIVNYRSGEDLKINEKINVKWMGKVIGERTNRQYLIKFDSLEVPVSALLFDDDVVKISGAMKKSIDNFRVVRLHQTFEECRKSLTDLMKAVYIVSKYNDFRTQFTTLEGSKDERKILYYQNNSNKVLKGLCDSIVFKIGLNNLENNQKMILSNISKNSQRIEYLSIFMNAIRAHLFKENLISIQNLRENCGGYGYLQYSGIPNIQENSVLNVGLESNYQDYLANLALVLLKKFGTQENCEKFINYYFPLLYNHEKIDAAYKDIDNLPSKSLDNFVYLGRLINLKTSILRKRLAQSFKDTNDELNVETYYILYAKLLIKNDPVIYGEILEFGQSLVDYYCTLKAIDFVLYVIYRPVNKMVLLTLNSFIMNRLLENYSLLTDLFKGKTINDVVNSLNEQTQTNYEQLLRNYLSDTIDSFEYDENSLNCILEGDRDQFYGKLLDTMKNKNKRNDPKTVEEMVAPLIKFLNRPNL